MLSGSKVISRLWSENHSIQPDETAAITCADTSNSTVYSDECLPAEWVRQWGEYERRAKSGAFTNEPSGSGFVLIIRDPREIIVSWMHFRGRADKAGKLPQEDVLKYQYYITRVAVFFNWYAVRLASVRPTVVLFYDEVMRNPVKEIGRMASVMGLNLSIATCVKVAEAASVDSMRKKVT